MKRGKENLWWSGSLRLEDPGRTEAQSRSATKVRIIDSAEYSVWDQYVLTRAAAGTYLTVAWKQAVETGYKLRTFYLAAFNHDTVTGVLPLALVKLPLVRACLVSLPYCDYGGLLADSSEVAAALLDRAIDLAQQLGVGLDIRTSEPDVHLDHHVRFVQVTNKCRMVLQLPGSATPLWDGFKSKLRSQVNSALRHGLVYRAGGPELLPDFYSVFCRNMRDLGSPVHSINWLRSVLAAFGRNAQVGVVYQDALPTAAGIVLTQGRQAAIPWASSLREFNRLNPNMLLYWKFLEQAADCGLKCFDFGRSTPGEGTYAFKRQWGAQPVPLHWFSDRGSSTSRSVEKESGSLRRVAESLWRRLPLPIANTAGPRIRKYVSR